MEQRLRKILIKFIQSKYYKYILLNHLLGYVSKSNVDIVSKIQSVFRQTKKTKDLRLNLIQQKWNKIVPEVINNFKNSKNKKLQLLSKKILTISDSLKKSKIQEYFNQKRIQFKVEIREWLEYEKLKVL